MNKHYPDSIRGLVSTFDDLKELRQLRKIASARNTTNIAEAAVRRLVSILPSEALGTTKQDFWQSIFLFGKDLLRQILFRVGNHEFVQSKHICQQ